MKALCATKLKLCWLFPVLTVITSLEVRATSLKHWNYVCLSIFMVHHGLSKIKLAFDAQCKIVILLYLLTYLNGGLKPIPGCWRLQCPWTCCLMLLRYDWCRSCISCSSNCQRANYQRWYTIPVRWLTRLIIHLCSGFVVSLQFEFGFSRLKLASINYSHMWTFEV